jgi:hypothetical protein
VAPVPDKTEPPARLVQPVPFDHFKRPGWRQRLRAAALAIVVALGIIGVMLDPPGGVKRVAPPPPADVKPCAAGQTRDCVGSMTSILPAEPSTPGAKTR